jgi:hypothetical protein
MINKQRNQGKEDGHQEQSLNSEEMGKISNAFLGQMGHEQEGKTESFQGNWSGNYGSGVVGGFDKEPLSGDFVAQSSNTGNGLNSDEDDLLASGQSVDDLGLGSNSGTTQGKRGENKNGDNSEEVSPGDEDTDGLGAVMPDPEDTTDQNASQSENGQQNEAATDEGTGLATSGDVASMIGEDIDDFNLPSAADVAGWRKEGQQ